MLQKTVTESRRTPFYGISENKSKNSVWRPTAG